MKVKVGDKVKILAGKDKGKEGTVTVTLKKKDKVVVSGINIVKKHMKPSAMNETGGIVSIEAPIHVSNVKVIESTKSAKKASAKVESKTTKATKTTKTAEKKTTKKTTKKEVGEDNE